MTEEQREEQKKITEEQNRIVQEAKEQYEKNRTIILDLVKDGKLPTPRKLNRSERRKIDAAKLNILKTEPGDQRSFHAVRDDLVDWILDNIYPDFNFDQLDNDICTFFGEYVFGLSNRNDLTVKN